jgi:hypothetical protein
MKAKVPTKVDKSPVFVTSSGDEGPFPASTQEESQLPLAPHEEVVRSCGETLHATQDGPQNTHPDVRGILSFTPQPVSPVESRVEPADPASRKKYTECPFSLR